MNISDRLVGSRSRECVERFYQTCLVRITHRTKTACHVKYAQLKGALRRPLSALTQTREGDHFLNSHTFFGRNGSNKTIGRGKR